jgi:ribosome-binding protein aMBF1 (putative translation factor)
MSEDVCVLCGETIELDRVAQVCAALDGVVSFVCNQCAEEVRAAVEHSVKAQVTEFRRIQRIHASALLN